MGVDVDERELLEWLGEFALATRRLTVLGMEKLNSCIATTRLGLSVLERFGISGSPRAVLAMGFNAEAWSCLAAGRCAPSEWPAGAWSVGVGGSGEITGERGDRRWDGHLVVLVRLPSRRRLLVDLTADQLSRPARQLQVPGPVLLKLPALWFPRDPAIARLEAGAVVSYEPMVGPATWQVTPDWSADFSEATDVLVEHLTTGRMRPLESRVAGLEESGS